MKISKIYVDMDGVLCDFEKRYVELYGSLDNREHKHLFRSNFDKFISTGQFATLELMPDALTLIHSLNTLNIPKEILSSTAFEDTFDEISKQKKTWLKNHNIDWKPNFVPGKKHKYKYATPDSVIIDDTLSVIEDWRKAGGIAIWHKDALSTISQLHCIMSKDKYPYMMNHVDNP
jgi:uncharacterized HAD superfamily protein